MLKKARLLLKVDRSSNGAFVRFIIIANFLVGLFYIYQAIVITPNISSLEGFRRHIFFMVYQHIGSILTVFMVLSHNAVKDFKNYSKCLVFPIDYKEFILFIKLRYGRFAVITIILNIINFILLGIKFNQPPSYNLMVIGLVLFLTIIIYMFSDILMYLLLCIFGMRLSTKIYIVLTVLSAFLMVAIITNVSEMEFYANSLQYINSIEGFFPNLILIKSLILNAKFNNTTLIWIVLNILVFLFMYTLYGVLTKCVVNKIISFKETGRVVRGRGKISTLRKRSPFVSNIILEFKFFRRCKLGAIFNGFLSAYAILSIAIFCSLQYYNAFEMEEVKEIILSIRNANIPLVLIILGALGVDYFNYEFSTNSFKTQRMYLGCTRYLNVDFKKLFFAKYFCKWVVTLGSYFFLVLPLFLFGFVGEREMKFLPLTLVVILLMELVNTLIDFNLPNIYDKIDFWKFLKACLRLGVTLVVKVLMLFFILNGYKAMGMVGITIVFSGLLATCILAICFMRDIRIRYDYDAKFKEKEAG